MKIVLLSNQLFLEKELKKSTLFPDISTIKTINELYDLNLENSSFILFQHLDCIEDNILNELNENFNKFYIIALRNNTNNIEGCTLLKKGYKAYVHSISNINILENVISTVQAGNSWIYPELMQFLIQSVPLKDTKQSKLFEELTIKELEIIELVAQGLNNAQIANTLDLAEVTVKKYISSLFKKLDVKDRLSLALTFNNHK